MNISSLVVITDHPFPDVGIQRSIIEAAGFALRVAQCRTADDVPAAAADADGLLVNMAPITAEVLRGLPRCRVIVRYGVGVDNVDLAAARERGIAVCNLPDFCTAEVADHALALALALARRLPVLDRRVRSGGWGMPPEWERRPAATARNPQAAASGPPPSPAGFGGPAEAPSSPAGMPALAGLTFAVAGFGRIGRAVLDRARAFGFRPAAYDPLVPAPAFGQAGVARLEADALFREADVLSLHLPLTAGTRGFVNAERLAAMKPSAVLVNTSRGGLVDADALAEALRAGRIAGAGLDVFEPEPLPASHPLCACPNAILTPHLGWYSDASRPRLQRMAAEEMVRGLRGQPLKSRVNV